MKQENDIVRNLRLRQEWHQEMMSSKKMIKDYDVLDYLVKKIVYQGLNIVEKTLQRRVYKILSSSAEILMVGMPNHYVGWKKVTEVTDKLSRLLILIL